MIIDRVIYPITTLGPGKRIAIWTQGCSKRCKNCASSELWTKDTSKDISVEELLKCIKEYTGGEQIDGITITGGDPLEQPEELELLLKGLREICSDILVYTGYVLAEVDTLLGSEYINMLRNTISVLIDGRYVDEQNDSKIPLRGSVNQKLYYFDDTVRGKYEEYMKQGRQIQNVYYKTGLMSVGIHNKDTGGNNE